MMSKVWSKISQFWSDHQGTFLGLVVSLASFAAPLKTAILCVLALTMLDNIVAVFLAIKQGGTVESSKLRRTANKLFIYLAGISAAFITETSVLGEEKTLGIISKSIIFFISTAELKSILENLTGLATLNGQSLNFWQVILANLQQKGGTQFTQSQINQLTQSQQQNVSDTKS